MVEQLSDLDLSKVKRIERVKDFSGITYVRIHFFFSSKVIDAMVIGELDKPQTNLIDKFMDAIAIRLKGKKDVEKLHNTLENIFGE